MEVKIQFPEPVAKKVLELPDRDKFVSRAVARALESRRAPRTFQDSGGPASRTSSPQDPPGDREGQLPPLNGREREDAWRRSNREFLQGHFAGQWVVLEGEEVVAHSSDAAQAVKEARAKGVAVPFVFYVEAPRKPGVVRIGL